MDILLLIIGLGLILAGANFLTDGSAAWAQLFRVPEFIIGLTVVAVGTSTPELVVSALSAIAGKSDVAIGNVVGSNIFNVFVILGVCALIRPLPLTAGNIRRDIPFGVIVSLLLLALAADSYVFKGAADRIGRIDGIVMVALYIALMRFTIRTAKRPEAVPAAAGAIVMNVTSVSSLGKYLATGMPVVSRVITVDGDACAKPQNIVVPVGTSYQDIIDFAGVKGGVTLGKVVAGGAMMGPAVENLSYPTTKTTSGLILLSKAAAQPAQVNPCIRCGRCVEYCPMGLEPVEVNQAYAARDVQELGKLHADYCFNCGSCSFVCPAKRPVTQMMSLAKAFYLGEIKKGGNK